MKTDDKRLILFHKHPVSANLNFFSFSYRSVCAFNPLPKLSALRDNNSVVTSSSGLVLHPAMISAWGEEQLELESGALQIETEFCEQVEVPSGNITVYLAGFTGRDIPKELLQRYQAKMLSLMECVGMAPVEMMLLQKAYRVIMGG